MDVYYMHDAAWKMASRLFYFCAENRLPPVGGVLKCRPELIYVTFVFARESRKVTTYHMNEYD